MGNCGCTYRYRGERFHFDYTFITHVEDYVEHHLNKPYSQLDDTEGYKADYYRNSARLAALELGGLASGAVRLPFSLIAKVFTSIAACFCKPCATKGNLAQRIVDLNDQVQPSETLQAILLFALGILSHIAFICCEQDTNIAVQKGLAKLLPPGSKPASADGEEEPDWTPDIGVPDTATPATPTASIEDDQDGVDFLNATPAPDSFYADSSGVSSVDVQEPALPPPSVAPRPKVLPGAEQELNVLSGRATLVDDSLELDLPQT